MLLIVRHRSTVARRALVHNATTQDDGDGNESTDSEWTGHRCESAPLCGNLSVASRTAFPLSTCPHECITTGAVALAGDVPFEQAVACTVNPIANRRRPGRQCHGRGIWRMVGAARSRKVYVAASRAARSCGRVAQARSPPRGGLTGVLQGTFEKGMFTCVVWLC